MNSVQDKVNFFTSTLAYILNIHAPIQTIRITKFSALWLIERIKLIMSLRDEAKPRYLRASVLSAEITIRL